MTTEEWELAFLAICVWREVRNRNSNTIRAVAHTIRNRVAKPGWWGSTWSEVLSKRLQYSSMTNPGDPNLVQWPNEAAAMDWGAFQNVMQICSEVYAGQGSDPSGGATHYYTGNKVPNWVEGATHTGDLEDVHFYIAK